MLSSAVSAQGFQMVARWKPQILKHVRSVQCREHGPGPLDQIRREPFAVAILYCARSELSTCADDHAVMYHDAIHNSRRRV